MDIGILFLRAVEVPGISGEEDQRAVVILREARAIGVGEFFQGHRIRAFNPARCGNSGVFEFRGKAVLGGDARGEDFELQGADDTDDPFGTRERLEDLRGPLFGKVFERATHMLDL